MPLLAHIVVVASIPFILLQIAMIYFICRRRSTDEHLRSGFFTVFCAVSVADCTFLVVVDLFAFVPNVGLFPEFYARCAACPNILFRASDYIIPFQLLGHLLIAVNRFTCFGDESVHGKLWAGRCFSLMLIAFFGVPLLPSVYQFGAYQWGGNGHYLYDNGSIRGATRDVPEVKRFAEVTNCAFYSVFTILDLGLTIGAVVRIRRFGNAGRLPANHRMQIKLLVYSFYITCVQLMRALYFLTAAFKDFVAWPYAVLEPTFHHVLALYCLSGTVFLLAVRFLYTGTTTITEADVLPLLYLGKKYLVGSLVEVVMSHLEGCITAENVGKIVLAGQDFLDDASPKFWESVETYGEDLLQSSPEFLQLRKNAVDALVLRGVE